MNRNVEEEDEASSNCENYSHATKIVHPKDIALWPQIITPEMQRQFLIEKPSSVHGSLVTSKTTCQEGSKTVTRSLTEKHENSRDHMLAVGTFVTRSSAVGRIDTDLEHQYQNEKKYWREVLKRIIATIKYLAKHGLAFRGSNQSLFTAGNGNYLGALEYLSEFDGFLANHLEKYSGKGKGSISYLSATVCDEFIMVIQDEVKSKLINEVKSAKYFSIIVDSTPDASHVDQLTIVLRYVLPDGKSVERFFGFIPIFSHTGQYLETVLINALVNMSIDIRNCRGQSFDNASNMSGKYNGLQAKIKNHSNTAEFVPCSSRSLNLIGNSAADCCLDATKYFDSVQHIYVFLSAPTQRWNRLEENFKNSQTTHLTVKKICDTRWSARADAIKALQKGHHEIHMTLDQLSVDISQKKSVQLEAKELSKKIDTLESFLLTLIWDKILSRFNATSESLQNPHLCLHIATDFIKGIREDFDDIERQAISLSKIKMYEKDIRRTRHRTSFADESHTSEVVSYRSINDKFKIFFVDVPSLDLKKVGTLTRDLKEFYKSDIASEEFDEEVYQFLDLASKNDMRTPQDFYEFIIEEQISSTFPNVEIILRIYLTLPVSNATGDRSFSVLKRVKNYLRSTLSQEKVSSLALLCIEKDVFNGIDYEDIINTFAQKKCRKVPL
ncbi:zinc finger MYM-type protein 1-like [Athalia rosae]|uniref:zinc finger MYM-type protein 1-like n=1 Tax=Athalia rosae TaxID=37344 RepID=UPI002033869C|nr:zinc finger MYM-type protein 1-like [Athalia rosae]